MRAIALTESNDHVCGRYRVRAFEPSLANAGWSVKIEGLAKGVLARLKQFEAVRNQDATLIQRKLLPGWQLARLRRLSRHLLFDFDDAVLYRDSYDPRGPHCPRRLSRFRATVRTVDQVIAGNAFLAECAVDAGAKPDRVRVIPTCIDLSRYPEPGPGSLRPDDRSIALTWVGSSSTLAGLEAQRDLLGRVGRDVPGARLRLICDRFPDLGGLPVEPVVWSEAGEPGELSRGDVGISWIPDDLWSRGKCGLKLLQYGAAGLASVTNPVGVHPEILRDGLNGFLAETPQDWVDAIRALRDEPTLRASMGREARRIVEQDYSIHAWASTFVAAISGRSGPPGPHFRGGRDVPRSSESTPPPRTSVVSPGTLTCT